MLTFKYDVIEMFDEDPPEDFGIERFDHHPVPGEVVMLHWLDGSNAYEVKVHHADPVRLKVFVLKVFVHKISAPVVESTEIERATERLKDVGQLVVETRDRLIREVGERGLAVAVVVRTLDGSSVHVGLVKDVLEGASLGQRDLVAALQSTLDEFLDQCPSVVHLPAGDPS